MGKLSTSNMCISQDVVLHLCDGLKVNMQCPHEFEIKFLTRMGLEPCESQS